MWRFVLAVSLLCCSSDASVTCKDESEGEVDWYILYKAPKNEKNPTGLKYIYIGPDVHGKVTKRTGTDIKGILGNTLTPILKSVRKMPKDFGFISYSDQPPGCSADIKMFGHSKGVVMVDKTTAVWLLHSTPQFPFRRDQNKFWPDSGEENAQTFICVTFPSETANIKHIGKHLQSIGAFPFDHDIPDGFYDELKDAVNWNKQDPPGELQELIKKGDVEFYSIAKKQAEEDDDLNVGDVYFAIAEKMLLSQRRTRCREFTGPTPHSVAVRAKLPSSRPADHLILERQRQDAARDQVLEFTRYQQTCDVKNSWLKSSDRHFLRGTVQREIRAAMKRHESDIEERRHRLRELLEAEEQQLLQEVEEKKETTVERQAKMREKAKVLRERRESERQQLVSDKLDQLFREQCDELRTIQTRRREQQVCAEREAQVRSGQEERRRRQEEEKLFEELWEADRRAKEERERRRVQTQQQRNMEQLDVLKTQMEAAEQQRQKEKELREEEARLR
ncbi:deoxyribonuclease-2-beta-like protein, partial [Lates japonicus]